MTPRTRTSRWRLLAVLSIVSVLALGACGEDKDDDSSGTGGDGGETSTETIDIGSQAFSESRTLAEVYTQYLDAKGFDVAVATPIDDRTQLYAAMDKGTVDLEIDYLGSAVVELKGEATSDADETYAALETALEAKGWQAAADGEATNANALVALASWAEENEVTTISDLKNLDGPLTLGGTPECAEREDCLAGYNGPIYDLGLEYVQVAYGPAMVTALRGQRGRARPVRLDRSRTGRRHHRRARGRPGAPVGAEHRARDAERGRDRRADRRARRADRQDRHRGPRGLNLATDGDARRTRPTSPRHGSRSRA